MYNIEKSYFLVNDHERPLQSLEIRKNDNGLCFCFIHKDGEKKDMFFNYEELSILRFLYEQSVMRINKIVNMKSGTFWAYPFDWEVIHYLVFIKLTEKLDYVFYLFLDEEEAKPIFKEIALFLDNHFGFI